eukprot:gene24112-30419_t
MIAISTVSETRSHRGESSSTSSETGIEISSSTSLTLSVVDGTVKKLDTDIDQISVYLGILGMPGRTAWFGLMEAGRPRPGETVIVSGAAGAVGSLVVQYAKLAGCKVYGIAGGEKKCSFLVNDLKLDGAIDYKSFTTPETLSAEITRLTGGVDIYFDNVGGWITDSIIPLVKLRARVIICGQISQYDGALDVPNVGPRLLQHLLFQRASIQGVLARDFNHRMEEMISTVKPWIKDGTLKFEETVISGFDRLPEALALLFTGGNIGKMLVKVEE